MRPSVEIFEAITQDIIPRFVYVSDKKQYGVLEHWNDLQEVANNRLAGDCEDFAITIVNRCAALGAELSDFTIYMVAVGSGPDHVVLGCKDHDRQCEWIADCNERFLKRKDREFYYRWVSERNLGQSEWVNSND